jgi:hypothetical protein
MVELRGEVDPDRPSILYKFPVTNFTFHPGGCLGTFPFVAIPENGEYSFHLVDARLTRELAACGAKIKMKRLYRAKVWNPDIDPAECVVVRSAPATPKDYTANWMLEQDRVVRRAEGGWINAPWSERSRRYRIATIRNGPDPRWREVTTRNFIAAAFEGRIIKDLDDPLLSYLNDYDEVDPE